MGYPGVENRQHTCILSRGDVSLSESVEESEFATDRRQGERVAGAR